MRPTTSTRGGALPALLGAVVVAVVLGILGMHALNMHGVTGSETDSMSGMTGMAGGAPTTDHDEATAHSVGDTAATASALRGAPVTPGHHMGDMVMLCVVMLAAAGIALLALLLRRAPRSSWSASRPRPTTAVILRGLTPARTGTGPPSVWAFSVNRC